MSSESKYLLETVFSCTSSSTFLPPPHRPSIALSLCVSLLCFHRLMFPPPLTIRNRRSRSAVSPETSLIYIQRPQSVLNFRRKWWISTARRSKLKYGTPLTISGEARLLSHHRRRLQSLSSCPFSIDDRTTPIITSSLFR